MKQFLVKLIPPRPSFAQDMSEAERSLMQQHAIYWRKLLEKDTAVVFGPVMDPAGVWGLGIIEAESEDEALTLMANDPTAAAGLNKIEIIPISATFKRR